MAAPQTSVTINPSAAFAGMLADSGPEYTRSYVNDESSAEMPMGRMCKQGSTDKAALLLSAGTDVDKLLGVVRHTHDYAKDEELGSTGIKPDVMVGVLSQGVIWVEVAEAVAPGDPVRVWHAAGVTVAGALVGQFGKTADATKSILLAPESARWRSTASAAGLAQLELHLTGETLGTADT